MNWRLPDASLCYVKGGFWGLIFTLSKSLVRWDCGELAASGRIVMLGEWGLFLDAHVPLVIFFGEVRSVACQRLVASQMRQNAR